MNLPHVLSSHEEATVRCAKARPGSNSSSGSQAPVRSKTSGPHASAQHMPMLPVFISRCGAGRHVELIPSVFSIYFRIAHYPPRVEAGRITSCSRTSCSHPLVFLSITAGSPTILECLSHWLTPRMREGDRRVGPGNWSGRKCRVAKLFPNHQGRGSPQKYPGPLMNRVDARVLASDLAANRTLFGTHDCG